MSRPMKDSCVEWIGEIPADWELLKLKKIIKSPLQYGANESGEPFNETYPRYIRITDITADNKLKDTGKLSLPESIAGSYLLKDNDILFARSGATVGKTFLYKSEYGKSAFAGYLIKASILDSISAAYVFYYTLGYSYEKWKEQVFVQSTIQNIGADKYSNLQIPVPPNIEEQKQIVAFLDDKTYQIDSIIDNTKKSIVELKKYKQSLITEAIIKGLNPDVKMKNSGIEWVGDIPEHWEVVKIKRLFHEINERNEDDEDATLLSLFTAIGVKPRSEMEARGNKAMTVINYKIVKPNDLVVNKLLAWMGAIGYSDYEGVTSPDYDVYRALPNANVVRNYYNSYFRYTQFKDDCFKYGRGIMLMRWRTYPEQFKNISVVNPPLSEQQQIADYLDEKCAHIDSLIADKEKLISEFEDYKKALIYEYVTGKKEVE